jgi:hypothetical protein
MVSHTCNPSYTGGVGRRIVVPGQPWKAKIMKPTKHFERGRKRERWNGNIVGGKLVQGALCTRIELSQWNLLVLLCMIIQKWKKFKNQNWKKETKVCKGWGHGWSGEHLPSKHEALSSNSSTEKRRGGRGRTSCSRWFFSWTEGASGMLEAGNGSQNPCQVSNVESGVGVQGPSTGITGSHPVLSWSESVSLPHGTAMGDLEEGSVVLLKNSCPPCTLASLLLSYQGQECVIVNY